MTCKFVKRSIFFIKILEENIGKTHSDIHHSRILYDPPPRILEIKDSLQYKSSFFTKKKKKERKKERLTDEETS